MSARTPARITSNARGITVSHSEFLGEVLSTGTAFNGAQYSINPGLMAVFPWLAPIANRYEAYRLRVLRFHYVPQVGSSATGMLMMAVDFDPMDTAPVNQTELLNMNGAMPTNVWNRQTLNVNLALSDKAPQRFVRSTTIANSDLKTYDLGNFTIATQGVASGTLGTLYADYIIELYTPQMSPFNLNAMGGLGTGSAGLSASVLFGSNWVADAQATLPGTVSALGWPFQFTMAWSGYMTAVITGTTFSGVMTAASSTCAYSVISTTINAAATGMIAIIAVNASVSQYVRPEITAASVTGVSWYFGAGPYSGYTLVRSLASATSFPPVLLDCSKAPTSASSKLTDSVIEEFLLKKRSLSPNRQ
jgi:hypothetical protein